MPLALGAEIPGANGGLGAPPGKADEGVWVPSRSTWGEPYGSLPLSGDEGFGVGFPPPIGKPGWL